MNASSRRAFLKILGGGLAGAATCRWPLALQPSALAEALSTSNEFYIFIHAAGAWDVTLSLDPRNEDRNIIEPATTENTNIAGLKHWVSRQTKASDDGYSFEFVRPPSGQSSLVFGPAMGDLLSLYDRLTVFNGLSMNTVSHPDGTYFMSTGRHLAGGVAAGSSVDVVLAHEHGASQVFPAFSVGGYASSYLGSGLDQRAAPLRVGSIGDAARSLNRGASTVTAKDRDAVNLVLSDEAMDLANQSYNPRPMRGMALQLGSLRRLFDGSVGTLFDEASLASDPLFQLTDNAGEPTRPRFHASAKNAAAFAVRSFARNLGRCVAFACGGFDTHFSNYQDQAATQQEAFDIIALLVKALDATPHPTKTGAKLADHTHILVTSDFCRTPQININQGRDHYPNGSALVISPKFRGNQVFGRTNPDDLLPKAIKNFADGFRPVAPPDILATFLSAQGVVPRKHLRDGDVISEVLR